MILHKTESFPIKAEQDIVRARQMTREWAMKLGLRLVDQTKVVTAVSELARNTLVHGKGGVMLLEGFENTLHKGLRVTFEDRGPGIPDIQLALKDGFSTGNTLGLGLGGAKRLSNEFELVSKVGEGTRVTIARWA